jgi:hypothetical protein
MYEQLPTIQEERMFVWREEEFEKVFELWE